MNNISISVLIPVKTGYEYLFETVESVRNQTFTNWELIIGINGHPFNSFIYKLAQLYEEIDKIRVIDYGEDMCGKANTLNTMVQEAKYNHICILDVDDLWEPSKLEVQISELIKYGHPNETIIGTKCRYFGSFTYIPHVETGVILKSSFFERNQIINSSSMIPKKYAFWDINAPFGLEDYDLWLRLGLKDEIMFVNIPEILVLHRYHRDSTFNDDNKKYLNILLDKWAPLYGIEKYKIK